MLTRKRGNESYEIRVTKRMKEGANFPVIVGVLFGFCQISKRPENVILESP